MKIIDAFTFYNEFDLLNYRLNILNDVVDYFILVEATRTHKGIEKPLFYNSNKELYKQFSHKIIHVIVDDLYENPIINNNELKSYDNKYWRNEIYQRDCIDRGIQQLQLNDDDYIIICDCDEIPNPNVLKYIQDNNIKYNFCRLQQSLYYYDLNHKYFQSHDEPEIWFHPKMVSFGCYKNEFNRKPNDIRTNCNIDFINIINGGWHLSYFGDTDFIKNKIKNFAHQELNNEKNTNKEYIDECIKHNIIFFKNHHIGEEHTSSILKYIPISENDDLPPLYDKYLTKFYMSD
jgi:beta-1,4-mannosyl-glycoprotein beta-1,4-N-acetylglucosaminyltransferase